MKYKLATTMLLVAALVVATLSAATTTARPARAATGTFPINGCPEDPNKPPPCDDDSVILKWNEQLLATIRANPPGTGPTITSRALGVLHTATYDAWAAYDPVAKATLQNGNTEQPANDADKSKAISFAAYETLVDLFPYREPFYADQMTKLGYTNFASNSPTPDTSTPAVTGKRAAQAVINYRHADGSNQTPPDSAGKVSYPCTPGSASPCPYQPTKQWNEPTDQWRWQPLCVPLSATCKPPATNPGPSQQAPLTPQWGNIKSFASLVALQTKVPPPPKTTPDIDTAIADANLSGPDGDRKKVTAEYWADGPTSEFPPGHMAVFSQFLCRKRGNNLDTDVKFFFALGNALLDAGIASWWQKYKWDFWRPITAIRYQYNSARTNTKVMSWLGPNQGFGLVKGEQWIPYQAANVVTPPFPEYVSGHSTFSAAGNVIMVGFTGSDNFGGSVTIPANWSKFEANTPANPVTLYWPTFTAMANDAGMSRRYGGIHFKSGDWQGRSLGNMVGQNVWSKAQSYFRGTIGYSN